MRSISYIKATNWLGSGPDAGQRHVLPDVLFLHPGHYPRVSSRFGVTASTLNQPMNHWCLIHLNSSFCTILNSYHNRGTCLKLVIMPTWTFPCAMTCYQLREPNLMLNLPTLKSRVCISPYKNPYRFSKKQKSGPPFFFGKEAMNSSAKAKGRAVCISMYVLIYL